MTADFENLTLQHLRALRDDVRYIRDKIDDMEHQLVQLHVSDAKHTETGAHFYRRFHEYDLRIQRIERRLDISTSESKPD